MLGGFSRWYRSGGERESVNLLCKSRGGQPVAIPPSDGYDISRVLARRSSSSLCLRNRPLRSVHLPSITPYEFPGRGYTRGPQSCRSILDTLVIGCKASYLAGPVRIVNSEATLGMQFTPLGRSRLFVNRRWNRILRMVFGCRRPRSPPPF